MRRRPPPEVRAAAGSRVLAHASCPDGRWVAGTRELLLVTGEPARSLRWEEVHRADWDAETESLTVVPVGEFGAAVEPWVLPLTRPDLLLQLVRERVTASVVLQRRVTVQGRRGLTVIGRRAPGSGDAVTWAYEVDAGLDPADPAVSAAADRALAEAREATGR